MAAYYNEFDPKAAAWLRQLIKNGNITQGIVDERSIEDVTPGDLVEFDRVHFFAGVGTWDYCLNNSGWGDKPVWTASLPCQPFSAAGKGLGKADERHLLPHFLELVRQCKPLAIFGEQVERAINYGWLDDLQANMEKEGYAIGHVVLGAHSVNAAHIRQRLYWVADSISDDNKRAFGRINGEANGSETSDRQNIFESWESCGAGNNVYGMGNTKHEQHERKLPRYREEFGQNGEREASEFARSMQTAGGINWICCRDNKYRPVKSGIKPLVDGVPRGMVHSSDPRNTQEARKVRLKGYGNAIVPTLAAEFIKVYMQCES